MRIYPKQAETSNNHICNCKGYTRQLAYDRTKSTQIKMNYSVIYMCLVAMYRIAHTEAFQDKLFKNAFWITSPVDIYKLEEFINHQHCSSIFVDG